MAGFSLTQKQDRSEQKFSLYYLLTKPRREKKLCDFKKPQEL